MSYFSGRSSKIAGTGKYLPGRVMTNFDFEKDVSFMTHPRVVGKLVLKITLKNSIDPYSEDFLCCDKFIVVNYDQGLENEKEMIVNDAINLIYNILNVERTKV